MAVAEIRTPDVAAEQVSADGTRKWLLHLESGQAIETVFIPEPGRGTLCISSQVGCTMDCTFCSTAQQGFNRNLETHEIVAQVWLANRELGYSPDGDRVISNVVFTEKMLALHRAIRDRRVASGEPEPTLYYLSTAYAYGVHPAPIPEDYPDFRPGRPDNTYARTKAEAKRGNQGFVQRISGAMAAVLFEGGNWDKLVTVPLSTLESA